MGKAEITSEFILKRVAPYFNQHGYHATSMSDITQLTGLTKGAIYGNFENKEVLAMEAFRYNVRHLVNKIANYTNACEKSYDKLYSITAFYRNYLIFAEKMGGCPVLNVGIDSLNNNPVLLERVKSIVRKLKKSIQNIIEAGQEAGELIPDANAPFLANIIYCTIEGGIFSATVLNDEQILIDSTIHIDDLIKSNII